MPLSRIVIAAVAAVIGALIIFPMFRGSSSSSRAASSTPSASATASTSGKPSARPSRTPTRRPTPTHTTRRPSTPAPPSVTPSAPLSVTIGKVRCPGRSVQVTVVNGARRTEDYAILTDGSISVADRIPAGATRRSTLTLKEDRTTTVAVTWNNVPVKSVDRRPDCAGAHKRSGGTLPHTGPDSGMIFARVATGIAVILTGAIVFWYGRLWPRRRDRMFD